MFSVFFLFEVHCVCVCVFFLALCTHQIDCNIIELYLHLQCDIVYYINRIAISFCLFVFSLPDLNRAIVFGLIPSRAACTYVQFICNACGEHNFPLARFGYKWQCNDKNLVGSILSSKPSMSRTLVLFLICP